MKCPVLQRRLLSLENPAQLPTELQAHLAHCPSCARWHRRLVRLERALPLLPVPPSSARSALVRRIVAGTPLPQPARERRPLPQTEGVNRGGRHRERGLKKLALATALAAGLVLFALGWAGLQWHGLPVPSPSTPPPENPLVADLVRHDLELAGTVATPARFHALTALARDLQNQAPLLVKAAAPADLDVLERLQARVVYEGLLRDSLLCQVGTAQREAQEAAQQMARAATDLQTLADQAPATCAPSLQRMAAAARDAHNQLHARLETRRQLPVEPSVGVLAPLAPGRAHPMLLLLQPRLVLASAARVSALPAESSVVQARRFNRDQGLIEKLVDNGLDLAHEDDALKRAACCQGLVQDMAGELRQAADQHERARSVQLGGHLRDLLQRGVADNLLAAQAHIPPGSAEWRLLQEVGEKTTASVQPVETVLRDSDDAELQKTLTDIDVGRERVARALQSPVRP